jgi:hypothetical protein
MVLVSIITVGLLIIMVIFIVIAGSDGCFHFRCGGSSADVSFECNLMLCVGTITGSVSEDSNPESV